MIGIAVASTRTGTFKFDTLLYLTYYNFLNEARDDNLKKRINRCSNILINFIPTQHYYDQKEEDRAPLTIFEKSSILEAWFGSEYFFGSNNLFVITSAIFLL